MGLDLAEDIELKALKARVKRLEDNAGLPSERELREKEDAKAALHNRRYDTGKIDEKTGDVELAKAVQADSGEKPAAPPQHVGMKTTAETKTPATK